MFFRNIQLSGLQNQDNDMEDRSIKEAAQITCAIAFVPTMPEDFFPMADYFEI